MAKQLTELAWIESLLPADHIRKHMFGGFGYYINDKMVLALFESQNDKTYRGQKFDFEIWNGCLFPAEKENHSKIIKRFSFLFSHPILNKWLYLPSETENFEEKAELVLKEIKRKSELFGVIPKSKKTKTKTKSKITSDDKYIDTSKPRMFSDEPIETKLDKAKKISDLKNLGPSTEIHFHKAGIKTVQQFVKLGWKKTLVKLVNENPKNRHSVFTYALIGALKNKEWFALTESEKEEAKQFTNSLKTEKKIKPKTKK